MKKILLLTGLIFTLLAQPSLGLESTKVIDLTQNDIKTQISNYSRFISANVEGVNRFHMCFVNGHQYLYWLEETTIFAITHKNFTRWHKEIFRYSKSHVVPLTNDIGGSTYLVDQAWFFKIALKCLRSDKRYSIVLKFVPIK